MSTDRLQTFLEVYRQRSMGRAAAALSLTQPAVSNQIAALERELGLPLFVRSRTGVAPTPAADSLARDVAAPLDRLAEAMAARQARSQSLSGLVHLGAPPEMFSAVGPAVLAALGGTAIRLEVHLGGGAYLRQGLEDGTFDLALMASTPPERRYAHLRIGSEELVPVAHPAVRDALRGRVVDADALCAHPLIAYDSDLSLIRQYFDAAFGAECTRPPLATVPDLRSVLALAAGTPSWTVAPDYLAAPWLAGGDLVRLSTRRLAANRFYLVWPRQALRTPRIAFAKRAIAAGLASPDG